MLGALESRNLPDCFVDIFVFKLVENAVGPNQDVVILIHTILLHNHIRHARHYSTHPTQLTQFGFAITKRATDAQAAGEYPIRSDVGVGFVFGVHLGWGVLLEPDLLHLIGRHAVSYHRLGLVDMATGLYNSLEFGMF